MYWLMLLAGIAAPIMASAQSRVQELEPDYAQGYERSDSARSEWGTAGAPWADRTPATDSGASPEYRFRGDPPAADGIQAADPGSELRFRPLTPSERERLGPTTRWRPTDAERRGGSLDPSPERSTLFDALAPDGPPPDPWHWSR